jgi:hypothetical protein
MKTYFSVMLSIWVMAGGMYAQKSRNNWADLDLVGRVKYMKEAEYLPIEKNGKIIKGNQLIDDWTHFEEHYYFNKTGQLLKEEDYQKKHLLFYITTYAYGENGKKLRKETRAPVNKRDSYTIFTYDNAGNEVGVNVYFADSTTETYYQAFDFNGNCRYSEYYIDSIRYEKNLHTYNEKNQLIESKVFMGAWNENPEIYRFVYDAQNNIIETWYQGTLSFHYIYVYNEKNEEIEVRTFNDLQGGKEEHITTYGYDAQGRMIWRLSKSADAEIKETIQYTYDQHKNWIKKITYKNDQPVSIVERKIKYY